MDCHICGAPSSEGCKHFLGDDDFELSKPFLLPEEISKTSPSPFGTSKRAELKRTAEQFREICKTQKAYFALSLLLDSQYTIDELEAIRKELHKIDFKK